MGSLLIPAPIKDEQFTLWGEKHELNEWADLIGCAVLSNGREVGKVSRGWIDKKLKKVFIEIFLTGVDGHRNHKLKIRKPEKPNTFSAVNRFTR